MCNQNCSGIIFCFLDHGSLGLFNSWPFFLATLFAPIYIYPVVKYLNVYKKTNPRKSIYRFLINLEFTLIGTILFWVFMSAYAGM